MIEGKPRDDHDPYTDWAAELVGANDVERRFGRERLAAQGIAVQGEPITRAADLWEPVFVRSRDGNVPTEEFFDAVRRHEDGLVVDPAEVQFNERFRRDGDPVEAVLYRRWEPREPERFLEEVAEVLAVGGLMTTDGLPIDFLTGPPDIEGGAAVAVAVIDDGLPVLHARLRDGPTGSRVAALWAQTFSRFRPPPNAPLFGPMMARVDVEAALATLGPGTEDDLYAGLAAAIYHPLTHHGLRRRATHGSLVLDLAAGVSPTDGAAPLREVPVLGVQLPPQAFDDTSGTRLRIPFLAGLRWLILVTSLYGVARSLVVNASLGVVAGPKDGTSFIERQIAWELERINSHPVHPLPTTLVLPYGNAYGDRLVARKALEAGKKTTFELVVRPDDVTPSYVELRLLPRSGGDAGDLRVGVRTPRGGPELLPVRIPARGDETLHGASGRPIARLYHVPRRLVWSKEHAHLVLAIAPTVEAFPGDLVAPHGAWVLTVCNAAGAKVDLVLQVQRDDTPYGRRTGARQAYFDGPGAHGWNPETRGHDRLEDGPITHEGTNSAYTGVRSEHVVTVGAARRWSHPDLPPPDDRLGPTEYTAQGADWSGEAPNGCAVAEPLAAPSGLRAAGMGSAASERAGGTSMASALQARALVLKALGQPAERPAPSPRDRLGRSLADPPPREA